MSKSSYNKNISDGKKYSYGLHADQVSSVTSGFKPLFSGDISDVISRRRML